VSDSPSKDTKATKPIAIVGGGIAGLATAWYLQKEGVPYVLFEASDRLGGLVHTIAQDDLVMEFGPDAFITRKPHALAATFTKRFDATYTNRVWRIFSINFVVFTS